MPEKLVRTFPERTNPAIAADKLIGVAGDGSDIGDFVTISVAELKAYSNPGQIWTPTITNLAHTPATGPVGTLVISHAYFIEGANYAKIEINGEYTADQYDYYMQFEFTLPTLQAAITDLYGHSFLHYYRQTSGTSAGASGGGPLGAAPDNTASPFTKALIAIGLNGQSTVGGEVWGFSIEGLLIKG